jgi:hypothetical protein
MKENIENSDSNHEMTFREKLNCNYYQKLIDTQFMEDVFIELNIEDNPKRELLYSKAYELGHSSGYNEIYNYMLELVDLIRL